MSSKRAQRRRSCSGKVKIVEEDSAWRIAKLMTQRHGQMLLPYRCSWCGGWHVGHPSKRALQRHEAQRRANAD